MYDLILYDEFRGLTVLGLKVTVMVSVAASIGGVVGLSAVTAIGVLMKKPISEYLGAWCGDLAVALPHSRVST